LSRSRYYLDHRYFWVEREAVRDLHFGRSGKECSPSVCSRNSRNVDCRKIDVEGHVSEEREFDFGRGFHSGHRKPSAGRCLGAGRDEALYPRIVGGAICSGAYPALEDEELAAGFRDNARIGEIKEHD